MSCKAKVNEDTHESQPLIEVESANHSAEVDIPWQADSFEHEITEDVDERLFGTGNLALHYRGSLLGMACVACMLNNGGVAESELILVSQKGFLPIWIRDPLTDKPIEVLRQLSPTGTQIAYWPVQDAGWDFYLIPSLKVADADAVPIYKNQAWTLVEWSSNIIEQSAPGGPFAETCSDDDWDVMIWTFVEMTKLIADPFLWEHNRLPMSFAELLDGHYVVNEDFLIRARELIEADVFAPFEMGIMPEYDVLYFDYRRRDGIDSKTGWRYRFPGGVYDLTAQGRSYRMETPSTGARIIFFTEEQFLEPDTWLTPEDRVPLSSFYNPN